MSSSSSLPGLRDDMSPIRPASSMSNISVSSVRSHKKRRAPPPPVQLSVKPIPEENSPEKTVQRVPSPTPSNASIIPDIEAVQGDTAEETLQHESPGLTENPQLEDKKQMYAKVNKVKTNEVIHDDNYNSISVKEEYEIHESVIICDENETDNHVYETVEIKKELNTNEDLVIKEEYEQETRLNEFDAPEDTEKREKKKKKKKSKDINEYDQDEAHNMDGEAIQKKKKKKKDKERDRSLDNDDEHKKKKKKKHKNSTKDDEIIVDEKTNISPSNLITSKDLKENENYTGDDKSQHEELTLEIKSGDTTGDNNEQTENVQKDKQNYETLGKEQSVKGMESSNEKRKYKDEKRDMIEDGVDDQNYLNELPSFRGAKAVDVQRMSHGGNGAKSISVDDNDENLIYSENDSLVNSDDELVDLFALSSRKGGKQNNKKVNSESAKQKRFNGVSSSNKQHNGTNSNLSSDPANQDTDSDVSDALSLAESENESKYLSISEQDEGIDKLVELPKKITGKEIEEKKKSEIRMSMGAKANRRASDEGNVPAQMQSETIRQQLKIGMQPSEEPAYKREFREVELDINSDDDLLPSMRSSRSNSVSSVDEPSENNQLHSEFAMKEMEKDVQIQRKIMDQNKLVNSEISKALDESYEAISLTNTHDSEFTAVKDTIFVDENSVKSDSPIIFEATNPKFSGESTQNYEFSDHDSVSTLSHPSNDDMPGMSGDNLLVSHQDVLTNLSSERRHHEMLPHTNMMNSTRQEHSIKSPSPDSGIHDFADTCSSPVSSNNEDQLGYGVTSSIQQMKMMEEFPSNLGIHGNFIPGSHHTGVEYDATTDQTLNGIQHNQAGTPDSGLDLQSSDVASSEGNDVSLHDVSVTNGFEGGGMEWHARKVRETMPTPSHTGQNVNVSQFNEDKIKTERFIELHENVERVELPKRHNLDKVLFTMSSYTDRKHVEQSNDVCRTESFNMVADKLNSSLAARQKLKMEGENKPVAHLNELDTASSDHYKVDRETSVDPDAVNYHSSGLNRHTYTTKMQAVNKPSYTPADRKPISFVPAERPQSHTLSRSDLDRHEVPSFGQYAGTTEHQHDTFRSRIIEEFEAKKGVVIIGSSGQDSLENHGPGEIARTHSSRAHYGNQSASAHTTNIDQTYLHTVSGHVKTELGHTRSLDREAAAMGGGSERPWVARKKSYEGVAGYSSLDRGGREFVGTRPGIHANNSHSLHDNPRQGDQNHYDSPRNLMSSSKDVVIYDSVPSLNAEIPVGRVVSNQWQEAEVDKHERVQTELQSLKETKYSRPGPPSISMGVWGEQPRASQIKIKEDTDTIQSIGKKSHAFSKLAATKHTDENLPFHRDGPSNSQVMEHKISSVKEPVRKVSSHELDQPHRNTLWTKPEVQPKPIEIRYRNGHTTEVMDNPRNAVILASKKSRGDKTKKEHEWINASTEKTSSRVDENMPSRPKLHSNTNYTMPSKKGGSEVANDIFRHEYAYRNETQNITLERSVPQRRVSRKEDSAKTVNKDTKEYDTTNRSNPPAFYFGMSPANLSGEDMPSLRTAIGKVKDNEALSQPFRQQPRHIESKNTRNSHKLDVVPNPQGSQLQINLKSSGSEDKIVIVKNNDSASSKSNNNNNFVTHNLNSEERYTAKLPPKEKPQEEINREFQNELLKAKSKLKMSGRSETISQSQDGTKFSKDNDGSPPPPPPPVLPNTLVRKTPPARENNSFKPSMNAREELMLAIRNKGGKSGLRPIS